jgi:archaemetzincin
MSIGSASEDLIRDLSRFLAGALCLGSRPDLEGLDPAFAKNRERGQVNARDLLPRLEERAAKLGTLVLGVTEEDLYSPVFTFVFGEARLGGQAALFSLNRLRPERYGLPADPQLLIARARREALHETGHLLSLAHCKAPDCAMRFSGSAEEIDLKRDALCAVCAEQILESLPKRVQ